MPRKARLLSDEDVTDLLYKHRGEKPAHIAFARAIEKHYNVEKLIEAAGCQDIHDECDFLIYDDRCWVCKMNTKTDEEVYEENKNA